MFIEEGTTIPVIGSDLLTAPDGRTLNEILASQLAVKLNIDVSKMQEIDRKSLNMVVGESELYRKRRKVIYSNVKQILDELIHSGRFPIPAALLKLVEIKPFRLFLTTTFDPLLTMALTRAGYSAQTGVSTLSYSSRDDLPVEGVSMPTVYHLFGRASATPDYAVTDCDILDFICEMQSQENRPKYLFQKLKQSNLLFLGTGFPDWLSRFFLRVAKSSRLWEPRDCIEVLADDRHKKSDSLVYFCKQFSFETSIYPKDAVDFVNELYARWKERNPVTSSGAIPNPPSLPEMEPGSVFISYANEDKEQADRVRQTLTDNGLEVWFDKEKLIVGDGYEIKILQNVRQCDMFLPIISKNATRRAEGFFRKEWSWAVGRMADFFGSDRPFILPVAIDDTPSNATQLPGEFKALHWLRAPGGSVSGDAVGQLRQALREIRKRERLNA